MWATLIRLWLHSLSCHLQTVVVEIFLQFHRYVTAPEWFEQSEGRWHFSCGTFMHSLRWMTSFCMCREWIFCSNTACNSTRLDKDGCSDLRFSHAPITGNIWVGFWFARNWKFNWEAKQYWRAASLPIKLPKPGLSITISWCIWPRYWQVNNSGISSDFVSLFPSFFVYCNVRSTY